MKSFIDTNLLKQYLENYKVNSIVYNGLTLNNLIIDDEALWRNPIIRLEVTKVTSDTYAGETTYTAEEFILLDIYPKTNGTVYVTYGGLTKTITDMSGSAATEPNAQEVFFGTFNGVADEVTTPASGTLTIEGDYLGVGVGTYVTSSKLETTYCNCITAVESLGNANGIPNGAFRDSTSLSSIVIPNSVRYIDAYAFSGCTSLSSIVIPNSVETISGYAFNNCYSLTSIAIPNSVDYLGEAVFHYCTSLTSIAIPDSVTHIHNNTFYGCTLLETVVLHSTTPPVINGNPFGNTGINLIVVPSGCGDAYKAADGWSTYADYITEAT